MLQPHLKLVDDPMFDDWATSPEMLRITARRVQGRCITRSYENDVEMLQLMLGQLEEEGPEPVWDSMMVDPTPRSK